MPSSAQVAAWRELAERRLRPDQWNVSKPEMDLARAVPEMAEMLGRAMELVAWFEATGMAPVFHKDDGIAPDPNWRKVHALLREWRGEVDDAES